MSEDFSYKLKMFIEDAFAPIIFFGLLFLVASIIITAITNSMIPAIPIILVIISILIGGVWEACKQIKNSFDDNFRD